MKALLMAILVCSLTATLAFSSTLRVSPDGTGAFPTIQAALDAAADGDSIVLLAGTFSPESEIQWPGRRLTLVSEAGPEVTVIQGNRLGPFTAILHIGNLGAGGSTIDGIMFRSSPYYAVAFSHQEGVVLRNSIFEYNMEGLLILDGTTTIEHNVFRSGQASLGSVIVSIGSSSVSIRNNIVAENTFGGALIYVAGSGISQVTNNTIVGNVNASPGELPGACIVTGVDAHATIANNIVANNTAPRMSCYSNTVLSCNDFFDNLDGSPGSCVGPDNFSADPIFCLGSFKISAASPCAPANSPCGSLVGAENVECGGPVAAVPATWGKVKSLYRSNGNKP